MSYSNSLVVVCPASVRDAILALGAGLGVDGGMGVELSASGSAPVTHYGAHSWVTDEFAAYITRAAYPDIEGVSQAQIDAILDACVVSVNTEVDGVTLAGKEHFDHVIQSAGLHELQAAA